MTDVVQQADAPALPRVDFRVDPSRYRHWRVSVDGPVATLTMDVEESGGLWPGYELKLNSYDLGVDIELSDAVQRLRFEHPEVSAVIITSGKDKIFCAGANIHMLAASTHAAKVNFCKFTNETRNAIEDASTYSSQRYIAALNGTASGGGYELALACDHIMLVDDRSSAVSLPELPLLAVLPGTGGLTRLVDKRRVRRDLADSFATASEGARGQRALDWELVDELVPRSSWDNATLGRALQLAETSERAPGAIGISLTPLEKERSDRTVHYRFVDAELDHPAGVASISVLGPGAPPPTTVEALHSAGAALWTLEMTRELEDLILDLRTNEPGLGTWVFRTRGSGPAVLAHDDFLEAHRDDWLANEILLFLKRTLKRIDVTSRSLIALIEPGSCFAGSLLELALAADRTYQLCGESEDFPGLPPAQILVGRANFGALPMGNGLTRLESRFFGRTGALEPLEAEIGRPMDGSEAEERGLVTRAPDDIDWPDEVRLALEERASFSPDALSGLEANCRFVGPETIETKIFGRLSAWQNWIFSRPNAVGEAGALRRYGTGRRAVFDRKRV
jgi:benzoyl-CoA-dihydrodiol lyase